MCTFISNSFLKFMIVAVRNGIKKEFTTRLWNSLPKGKYGWTVAASVPTAPVIKPPVAAPPAPVPDPIITYRQVMESDPPVIEEQKVVNRTNASTNFLSRPGRKKGSLD